MKQLLFYIISLLSISIIGCQNRHNPMESDPLSQYRDTIIGRFNGIDIDTLIAEPIGEKDGGWYFKWRVFTKNGSVKDLILDNKTIGIHFVKEGDLDGNGTDEWGYVTEWETSNWMCYHAFTNKRGKWKHIIEPTNIWLPHLDPQDSISYRISKEDILQPSEDSGFLKVKFSDVRNNGEDFLIVDTLIMLNHKY